MEKSVITTQRSHTSCGGRLTAPSPHTARGWRPMTPAGRAAEMRCAQAQDNGANDVAASRPGLAAPCMVDASARRETILWRVACITRPTRRGGVPLPARGTKRGARRVASVARWRAPGNRHALGKGQEAYFASDGTGSRAVPGISRLSRCESLLGAQELRSATLSNKMCVWSNIFGFVTT
jgi:hypothetical protein